MDWIPEAQTFLHCMSLKTGCCIIGWLEFVFSILVTVEDFMIITTQEEGKLMRMVYWTDVVMLMMQAVSAIVLLIGVRSSNIRLINFWIWTHCGLAFFVTANFMGTISVAPALKLNGKFRFVVYSLLFTLRALVLYGFCLVVVHNYKLELQKPKSRRSTRR